MACRSPADFLKRSAKNMQLFEPIKNRKPFFTGSETETAHFDSGCPHCETTLKVTFKEMLQAAWSGQEQIEERYRDSVANLFHINVKNLSIHQGMPGVVSRICDGCERQLFFHFHFWETSNSVYSISLRGAATA